MGHDLQLFNKDIRRVHFQEWEDRVELVSGGPPCQPFSIGGPRVGILV
jgi:DNA (cytosine-5)-methyltransferase 1